MGKPDVEEHIGGGLTEDKQAFVAELMEVCKKHKMYLSCSQAADALLVNCIRYGDEYEWMSFE